MPEEGDLVTVLNGDDAPYRVVCYDVGPAEAMDRLESLELMEWSARFDQETGNFAVLIGRGGHGKGLMVPSSEVREPAESAWFLTS